MSGANAANVTKKTTIVPPIHNFIGSRGRLRAATTGWSTDGIAVPDFRIDERVK